MELSWLAVWGIEAWVCLTLLHGNNTDERATSCAALGAKSGLIGTALVASRYCGIGRAEPGGILFGPI